AHTLIIIDYLRDPVSGLRQNALGSEQDIGGIGGVDSVPATVETENESLHRSDPIGCERPGFWASTHRVKRRFTKCSLDQLAARKSRRRLLISNNCHKLFSAVQNFASEFRTLGLSPSPSSAQLHPVV